jgi:hypothetical protein
VLQAVLFTAWHIHARPSVHSSIEMVRERSAQTLTSQSESTGSGWDYFTTNTASTGTGAPNSNYSSFDPYQGQQFNEQSAAPGANLAAVAAKLEALQETQQQLERKRQTKVDRQWVVTRLAQAQSMILMAAALDTPTILMLITQPLLLRTLPYWRLEWPRI